MTTRQTIEKYFDGINKDNWEPLISEDMIFTSPSGAAQNGKDAYVTATKRFLQVVKSVETKEMIIDQDTACVIARYTLQSPKGNISVCSVAETLKVKDGKICSSTILFDTSAFRDFMAQG